MTKNNDAEELKFISLWVIYKLLFLNITLIKTNIRKYRRLWDRFYCNKNVTCLSILQIQSLFFW